MGDSEGLTIDFILENSYIFLKYEPKMLKKDYVKTLRVATIKTDAITYNLRR